MKKGFILLMLSLFFSMKFVSLNALEQTGLGVYDYTTLAPFEDNKHIIIKRYYSKELGRVVEGQIPEAFKGK